jgi:hypothetical protein
MIYLKTGMMFARDIPPAFSTSINEALTADVEATHTLKFYQFHSIVVLFPFYGTFRSYNTSL